MSDGYVSAVALAAERVAAAFAAQPFRPGQPYDPRPLVAVLAAELEVLREVVAGRDTPITVTPDGREDGFGAELADLMGYLQLLVVRYHRLADVPDHLRVASGRYLSTTHLCARRVRDKARHLSRRS